MKRLLMKAHLGATAVEKLEQEQIPKGESPNKELVEKAVEVKKEVEEVLKSTKLKIVGVMERSVTMNEIDRVVNEEDLKGKIKELESKIAQGSNSEDMEKIKVLKRVFLLHWMSQH
ncbi:hypothetical protein JHK86_047729 [Glycine max]|nr:hypothetical protein JHK86_047729 [Glycine max]